MDPAPPTQTFNPLIPVNTRTLPRLTCSLLLLLLPPAMAQQGHLAPEIGDPNDDIEALGQCTWGHEFWRGYLEQYDCIAHKQWSGVNCDGFCGDAADYSKIIWISSVWDHYYLTPWPGLTNYAECKTYAGYGPPRKNNIWCPDHSTAEPAHYYYQPHPAAAFWASEEKRGVHWYVRNGAAAHPRAYAYGTNYTWWGKCKYTVDVICDRNGTNSHGIEIVGPNNWRVLPLSGIP